MLSRWPVQLCQRPALLGQDGQPDLDIQSTTAGRLLWTRVHRHKMRAVTVPAIRLDAADGSKATALGSAVLRTLVATDDGMVIGDFNRTPYQSPASDAIAAGSYRAANEVVGMHTIHTTRSDTPGGRYIDYALCTPSFRVSAREQHKGIEGHHDLIIYECPWSKQETGLQEKESTAN